MLIRDAAIVFVFHRFRAPEQGPDGHDPALLRRQLAHLRRTGWEFVSLEELFARLRDREPKLGRAVAFTIDDGYRDQATVAAPVFAEFECPVTTFLTTGFLDGDLWLWWDKLEFVLTATRLREIELELDDNLVRYPLVSPGQRERAWHDLTSRCKGLADKKKHGVIAQLAEVAQVDLPPRPPERYAPMTWDQVRECERKGMTFGPHTVTHPILSRTSDEQSRSEISESCARLAAEVTHPVPVFAYPNGRLTDFGRREIRQAQGLGLVGALAIVPRYATHHRYRAPDGAFMVPRFTCPDDWPGFLEKTTGLERLKLWMRGLE